MKRMLKGTITRHRGYWCLRYRERIREGDTLHTVQRSKRLALVDAMHKTRRSVQAIAETILEPINKTSSLYVGMRLGEFVDNVYLPFIESKRRPSTVRGYKQMWLRYLRPRCASSLMHDVETRTIQALLDRIEREDKLAPQTMAHIKHLLGGIFHFAIAQNHLPKSAINPVVFAETTAVPDFDGRAYSLEEIALMLTVLPEPSRTVVATAAFTGLRAGEIRGLSWEAFSSGTEGSLGIVRVLRSIWRGRIGEPKNSRSKASVPLIPQLNKLLEQHREKSGNPAVGPIFANGAGKPVDLDWLYRRHMEKPLREAGIEWEGWHGFRRGLATNLERIGVRETIAAMILRHSNDRVTRKHYIKPPSIEAVSAMQRLSDTLTTMQTPQLLPNCSPDLGKQAETQLTSRWVQ
jgi:integrase